MSDRFVSADNEDVQGGPFTIAAAVAAVSDTASAHPAEHGKFVHPSSQGLYDRDSWLLKIPIFGTVIQSVGGKCTIALAVCYMLQRGIANNILAYGRYAMFVSRFGTDGMRYQRLANIMGMGWSIKAMTAVLADSFAFMHYTKRWYILICCVMGGCFALGFGLLPAKPSSADMGAGFLFLANWCIANFDILTEGQYSRLLRKDPGTGPSIVSMLYWTIMVGAIIAAVAQGPLSDRGLPQVGMFIAAAAQVLCIPFFVVNWYGEKTNSVERLEDAERNVKQLVEEMHRYADAHPDECDDRVDDLFHDKDVPKKDLHPEQDSSSNPDGGDKGKREGRQATNEPLPEDLVVATEAVDTDLETEFYETPSIGYCVGGVIEVNKDIFKKDWKIVAYCGLMTVGVVAMTVVTILGSTWDLLYACVVISVVLVTLLFAALPLTIAKGTVFNFFNQLLYLQLPGALDSFYMASSECVPNGPGFNFTFYNTIAAVIGNLGGMVGIALFAYVFSKQTFAFSMIVATLVQITASVFDIILVKRWNVYIGIPDHAMYILGDQIVYQTCYYLTYMPLIILLSRLCPRGQESIVFAIVAGFGNFGAALSNTIGSLLMELVWPVVTTVPCDFSNVPWLILTGHFGTPLINIPTALFLLPRVRMCDDLDIDGQAAARAVKKARAARQARTDQGVTEGVAENTA